MDNDCNFLAIEQPVQDTQSDAKKTCKVGAPSMEMCKQQQSADTGMQPKLENHQSIEHKSTISHSADTNAVQDIIPSKPHTIQLLYLVGNYYH